MELDLPDTPDVSEDVLISLQQGEVVSNRQLKTLNDFKLLQMAWVYDINFPPTLQIIHEKRYLNKIRDTLPSLEKIDQIYDRLVSYMDNRMEFLDQRTIPPAP